ncbi:hypothetical protein COO60DRAFT_1698667 [Scenedesmus sp. NREL 46B-D3]|nr:hypothetical protein COO60DRAFT_1698667 [Scenedesmus sp. NREL 46B-D3]
MNLQLQLKYGAETLSVSKAATCTVQQLKQELEQLTGLFVRNQKLIFKGKVLADALTLDACKLTTGSKVMLLQSEGLPVKGQASTKPNAVAQQRLAAAGAGKAKPGSSTSDSGSSQLAEKMANMAAARSAGTASSATAGGSSLNMQERRAAWSKTGVVALRDMQLSQIQPQWLQGIAGARAADLSHNRLASLPSTLCQLSSLASLKLAHNCLQDSSMPWQQLCSGLAGLTSLLLGHNQLTVLPACLGQVSGLVQLGLEGNSLQQLEPGALQGLSQLQTFMLQDNQLSQLPESLGCCSSLVALNVSRNALPALPGSMSRLARLQVLAADSNRLVSLPPELFVGCTSLATLSAHSNPITVDHLRGMQGYAGYEARRQARATKQLEGRVMADIDKSFSEGADVEQWQRWVAGPAGLGRDGTGRAGGS